MDQRSIELLEFPADPRTAGGRDVVRAITPVGRGARTVERSRPRRTRTRRDRPGGRSPPGEAGSRDRRRPRHRPRHRAGGPRRAPRTRPVPGDRDDARRDRPAWPRSSPMSGGRSCASSGASCTHCRRCARRWRAASIRSASCSTPPRRASAACARRSASPTTGCAAGSTRSSARSWATPSRSRSSRCATAATSCRSSPRRVRGSRASSTTPRAAAQTLFIEPLVAVELGNAWREAQVAEAEEIARILDELSAFVAANADALRETLGGARPVRLLGGQGVARERDARQPGRDHRADRGRSCCRPAIRACPARSSRSTSGSATATPRSS